MFWVIVLLGLLWNALGCFNFIMQSILGAVADLPLAYKLVIASRPGWVTVAFFIAVFGGALGCVLMLLRRATARPALFLSLIGVLLTTGYALWLGAAATGGLPVVISSGMSVAVAGGWFGTRTASWGLIC
jgi:hypothetical protein